MENKTPTPPLKWKTRLSGNTPDHLALHNETKDGPNNRVGPSITTSGVSVQDSLSVVQEGGNGVNAIENGEQRVSSSEGETALKTTPSGELRAAMGNLPLGGQPISREDVPERGSADRTANLPSENLPFGLPPRTPHHDHQHDPDKTTGFQTSLGPLEPSELPTRDRTSGWCEGGQERRQCNDGKGGGRGNGNGRGGCAEWVPPEADPQAFGRPSGGRRVPFEADPPWARPNEVGRQPSGVTKPTLIERNPQVFGMPTGEMRVPAQADLHGDTRVGPWAVPTRLGGNPVG